VVRNTGNLVQRLYRNLGSRKGIYNVTVRAHVFRGLAPLAIALACAAQTMPVRDLKPGMRGVGKTVFSGSRIEDFNVEILGVIENIGPRQSIILGRLSGGPLTTTGVMQGMSGSPVFIDGKLIGAVALAFPFAKEPIAGIRPIAEMIELGNRPHQSARAARTLADTDLLAGLDQRNSINVGSGRLAEMATPVSFSGFTARTIEQFAPQLRRLGLEPTQGVAAGAPAGTRLGDPAALHPGSMISVQLLTGDMTMGADGTVTHIDGKRILAFGHRFLSIGETDMPFARAEVLTLLPNVSTSFKISMAREWMGAITQDRNTAVAGDLGRRAQMTPVSLRVSGGPSPANYRFEMVNNAFLTPFLLQMAVFSALDATERSIGSSTFGIQGRFEFDGALPPLTVNNIYAGDFGTGILTSLAASTSLAYLMQNGIEIPRVKSASIELQAYESRRQVQLDQAWLSAREARPGQTVDLDATFAAPTGEIRRRISYPIPRGATPGPLYFTIADALTTNLTEFRHLYTPGASSGRTTRQIIDMLNALRGNTRAYVRVWRADPSFSIPGGDLPNVPASLALMLGRVPTANQGLWPTGSKVAEFEMDADGHAVSGSRTLQVEIKE